MGWNYHLKITKICKFFPYFKLLYCLNSLIYFYLQKKIKKIIIFL